MGVRGCCRNCCSNVMCDKYSSKHGYICNDCFKELLNCDLSIIEFMDSEKETCERDMDYWKCVVEKEFK